MAIVKKRGSKNSNNQYSFRNKGRFIDPNPYGRERTEDIIYSYVQIEICRRKEKHKECKIPIQVF